MAQPAQPYCATKLTLRHVLVRDFDALIANHHASDIADPAIIGGSMAPTVAGDDLEMSGVLDKSGTSPDLTILECEPATVLSSAADGLVRPPSNLKPAPAIIVKAHPSFIELMACCSAEYFVDLPDPVTAVKYTCQ